MTKTNLLILFLLFGVGKLYAQPSPSDDYLKTMNSFVAGSPEAAQIMKYVDFPVDLFNGTPQISIPIYTVTGKGIAAPVSISYHAGGGVKIDEQATSVGLGFLLNCGGEITREIRNISDDKPNWGFFDKQYPLSYYKSKLAPGVSIADVQMWTNAMHGLLDLEPDIYYFSFNENSGKFVYDDSALAFVCITEKGHMNIAFDVTNSTWTLTGPDGNKYFFSNKESSSSQIYTTGQSTLPAGSPDITSWKLNMVVNADATDTIRFNYNFNQYSYFTQGSCQSYKRLQGPTRPEYLNSFINNTITGSSKLTSIVGRTDSVSFVDNPVARLDLPQQYPIGKVIICSRDNVVKDIFQFNYSYFSRPSLVGTITGADTATLKRSLRLDSILEYGNSLSNANPLKHSFSYNATLLPARLSFAKDFWGYANSNTYTQTLAPPMSLHYGVITEMLDGADRYTDTNKLKAGILEKITLPTGGTVEYQYEPNSLGYAIEQANTDNIINQLQQISVFKSANQLFNDRYDDTFTVNEPANVFINNLEGGVIADMTIFPITPNGTNEQTPTNPATPYCTLESSALTGTIYLQYGNRYNIHLPNGTYYMKAYSNGLNTGDISLTRVLQFNISYKTLDTTSGPVNYIACGLRVKSITTKDIYSNVTNTRKFRYSDPVTDSSYGRFIGTNLSHYYEDLQSASNWGQYLVRTGNNNMPGQGSAASNIIYPKVIEEVRDNNITYRTEHYYSLGIPFYPFYGNIWPFLPATDIECGRGNEEMTLWKEMQGSSFIDTKIKKQVFNFDPVSVSDNTKHLSRRIYGIKCSADSYDNASSVNPGEVGFPPQNIQPYYTNINRLYLASDSTISYDLSNSNTKTTEWHDYSYGDYNQQPLVTRTGTSDGNVITQQNWYAADEPGFSPDINSTVSTQLITANRISQPLGSRTYKNSQLLSQQFTYGHFNGIQFLIDSLRQAMLSNPMDKEIEVLSYDDKANPVAIKLKGDKYRRYLWNSDRNLALATCVMPQNGNFVFTSFEYTGEAGTAGNAVSGTYAYSLGGSLTYNGFISSAGLDVYVWATGSNIAANGSAMQSTGRTKGNWTLYKASLGNVASVTISGSTLIDQLAIVPIGSDFEGNVYDKAQRIVAKVNGNMQTAFFEYDNFGRLVTVKDEKGNIVKQDAYQYQGAQ